MINDGKMILVISGPSGVGKGTIAKKIVEKYGDIFGLSISATSRPPRYTEVDGRDYFFLSQEEFDKKIEENDFLEYARYTGKSYGSLKSYVNTVLGSGRYCILEIEANGAAQVRKQLPDSFHVFVCPPSWETLEARLRSRNTEDEDKIQRRLSRSYVEIDLACEYNCVIVNDEGKVCESADEIVDIFLGRKPGVSPEDSETVKKLIKTKPVIG